MAIGTTVTVGFDSRAVQRGLAGITRGFSKLNKVGGDMAITFAKWGGALSIAGLAGVGGLAWKMNQIGEESRAVDANLRGATRQMGLFGGMADVVTNRLLELADATGRQTGMDDDMIVGVQAKLMTFKELAKTADQVGGAFDRATMASLDMQARGFGEASQNAVQLGKALEDPVNGLTALKRAGTLMTADVKRIGDEFARTGDRSKAFENILTAIERQMKNAAIETAKSGDKIKVTLGQIAEEFGKPFSLEMGKLSGNMESGFSVMSEQASKWGGIIGKAFSESLTGNFSSLESAGSFMAEAILGGLWHSFVIGLADVNAKYAKFIKDNQIWDPLGIAKAVSSGSDRLRNSAVTSAENWRVSMRERGAAGISAATPQLPMGPPAPPPVSTVKTEEKIASQFDMMLPFLSKIEENTRSGSKL